MEVISWDAWVQKAKDLFGKNPNIWQFKCVSCGTVQSIPDFIKAGVERDVAVQIVYQECIGRHVKGMGCYWTLYGLLSIHELEVKRDGERMPVFRFAEKE